MPSVPPPIRLKITCEGEPWSVCVRDVATNALIHNVSAIAWAWHTDPHDPDKDHATATITLEMIPVEFVTDNPAYEWIENTGRTMTGEQALRSGR